MKKQKLLIDVLSNIVSRMTFPIEYKTITSTATSVTLFGICDIRHIQPNRMIAIDSVNYRVTAYAVVGTGFSVTISKTTGQPDPPDSGTFNLYTPKFFHGTPIQQETEFTKIQNQQLKTPMIYLMEPFTSKIDNSWESSIYSRTPVTLCFLTEANLTTTTDEIQYNAVKPMYNLCQDFIAQMMEARMFWTDEIQYNITHHTKFGINIRESGTKKTLFTENLSGVSLDITLELYADFACCQDTNFLLTSQGLFLQVD